jgi:hypothetical protein
MCGEATGAVNIRLTLTTGPTTHITDTTGVTLLPGITAGHIITVAVAITVGVAGFMAVVDSTAVVVIRVVVMPVVVMEGTGRLPACKDLQIAKKTYFPWGGVYDASDLPVLTRS